MDSQKQVKLLSKSIAEVVGKTKQLELNSEHILNLITQHHDSNILNALSDILVSSAGRLMYSKLRTFLKKQNATVLKYKSIATSVNNTITLTGNHLIYGRKSFTDEFNPM